MTKIRQSKYLLAIVALLLVFAGCKGESPTAPTTPSGGGVTPPTNANITLAVSNASPLVDSTTVITATVTQNNQPVPNGTAVQFATTLGTFTDANANATIRTTTNGVATVTLTSSSAGTASITATVNNSSAKTQVTFSTKPITPPPPNTTPTITSISPTTGKPAGGDVITITGTNFVAPVRAIFDFGSGVTKEAQVVSVTPTQVQVISPPVDLGTGQSANATITLIVSAGTANEQKVSASTAFVYQAAVLTPKFSGLSPTSGPIDGGTRVTIFGEGFQAPVQVFFGSQDAQIINVTFNQIIVMSPTARDTSQSGSGVVTGPVDIKIVNLNSNTFVTAAAAFRYTPKMQITAMGPTEGFFAGGTRVTIDGVGFNDPVAVVIGGVAAQPIKVSGTQIIALTGAATLTGCSDIVNGKTTVTNIDNGDSADGPGFTYRVPKPVISNIVPATTTPGSTIIVSVANAQPGTNRITVGSTVVFATAGTPNPDGSTPFSVTVPLSGWTFTSAACTVSGIAGTQPQPTTTNVVYTNVESGCTDTATAALTINPPASLNVCTVAPQPAIGSITPPGCITATTPPLPSVALNQTSTGNATVVITNGTVSGAAVSPLHITGITTTGPFTAAMAPLSATISSGSGTSFAVTITFTPTAAGTASGALSFTNTDGVTIPTICLTGTAAP